MRNSFLKGKYFNKNEIQKPKGEMQIETKEIQKRKSNKLEKKIQKEHAFIAQQRKLKLIAFLSLKYVSKSTE
jgi:hypothetical protein